MEAIIFIGIQASGKSSFYRERFFATHVRISMDLLRTRQRERALLTWCLAQRQPFVVDNTNPSVAERAVYLEPARAAGFSTVAYCFESNVAVCMARNANRSGTAQIPPVGIAAAKAWLRWPTIDEGFDTRWFVRLDPAGNFIVEAWRDQIDEGLCSAR